MRLVGPSEVQHEEGSLYGGTSRLRVNSHEWFAEYMRRPVSFGGQIFYPDPQDRTLFHEGAGEQVKVLEPGHPFADYLFHKARYEARLDDDLRAWGNVVVLAENRAGQPVAAEVRVGERGSIVFIWPPQDDQAEELLGEAIAALLDARGGATDGWPLAEDEALDTERELLATRHRTEREELEARRAALRERKRQLFEDRNVTRVIAYWDKVTRAGTGRHDALQELYKLVELITGLYGGEQQTATTLGVPLATVKDIKELANRHEYDVRHAKPGETVQLGDEPFNDALTMGKTLIRAYLDHEFDELRKRAG